MDLEDIKTRIKYLKEEIAHGGYHDGWVLSGFKKELKELVEIQKKRRNKW